MRRTRESLVRKRAKDGVYFGPTKTGKSRRTISIAAEIMLALKTHRIEQMKIMMQLGSEYERNDLVFANEMGKPLDLKNLRERHFNKVLKTAGLEGFRIYDLRHSMATLWLAGGANPKFVSERLGHSGISMTLDTYSHVLPEMEKDVATRMSGMLYG